MKNYGTNVNVVVFICIVFWPVKLQILYKLKLKWLLSVAKNLLKKKYHSYDTVKPV